MLESTPHIDIDEAGLDRQLYAMSSKELDP
jgi:hypothetical protein